LGAPIFAHMQCSNSTNPISPGARRLKSVPPRFCRLNLNHALAGKRSRTFGYRSGADAGTVPRLSQGTGNSIATAYCSPLAAAKRALSLKYSLRSSFKVGDFDLLPLLRQFFPHRPQALLRSQKRQFEFQYGHERYLDPIMRGFASRKRHGSKDPPLQVRNRPSRNCAVVGFFAQGFNQFG